MGRTEEGVFALAANGGIWLERGRPFPWLTKQGHLNPLLTDEAPAAAKLLAWIHCVLGGDERRLAAKSRGRDPLPDFLLPEQGLIVEVDEIQHFTSDRLKTLESYPVDADVEFALDRYRALIETWRGKADGYRTAKPAADFPRPGGRRAQRAYFDAVRDLAAPTFGLRVCRVPAPECEPTLALERLVAAVEQSRTRKKHRRG